MSAQPGYPKTLFHPLAKQGKPVAVAGRDPVSGMKFTDYVGSPDRFQPVTVNNPDQEQGHRAMGYLAEGETPETVGYMAYPMMMEHPDATPFIPGTETTRPVEAKFKPLLVNSLAEQLAAEDKGYRLPGQADPEAYESAFAAPYAPGRVTDEYPKFVNGVLVTDPEAPPEGPQQYPKWLYLKNPDGSERDVLVESEAEERALLGVPDNEPTREELIKMADELGVKVDRRWSDDRIRQAVAA